MQMIKSEHGVSVLNPSVGARIAAYERMSKSLKDKLDELKGAILAEMVANGVIKLETEEVTITYIAPTDKESFDSKAFKAADPDTYDSYVRMVPVKASLRVKVKDNA